MVNDFFGLSLRLLKRLPELFYQCSELETFFSLLLRCACIENINATKTHRDFIKELCQRLKDDLSEYQERQASGHEHHRESAHEQNIKQKQAMWAFFIQQGNNLVLMYITALLQVPPKEVASMFVDTLVSLCSTFRDDNVAYRWLEISLEHVPINVFTVENKIRLLNTLKANDTYFRQSALQVELDLLSKRARSSAIRST